MRFFATPGIKCEIKHTHDGTGHMFGFGRRRPVPAVRYLSDCAVQHRR